MEKDTQLLELIKHASRQNSYWESVTVRALAQFAEHRPPERAGIKVADGTAEEIAALLGITPEKAAARLREALYLVNRLPATLRALEEGRIDMSHARAAKQVTECLTSEVVRKVEQEVLQRSYDSPHAYRRALRYYVAKYDPEGAEERRQVRKRARDVVATGEAHGTMKLVATLSAHEASAAWSELNQLAHHAKTPGDQRSQAERRADVLMDLIMGECGERERVPVQVNVTVPLTTLLGLNKGPGELTEHGPITAEYCRELAQNASLRRIVTDASGHVLAISRGMDSSPAVAEHVRMRDRTCRQPGCTRSASQCRVDHTGPERDDGTVTECDCELLCPRHSRMRERAKGWQVTQPEPGHLVFVTPAGHVHHVRPEPYEEPAADA